MLQAKAWAIREPYLIADAADVRKNNENSEVTHNNNIRRSVVSSLSRMH